MHVHLDFPAFSLKLIEGPPTNLGLGDAVLAAVHEGGHVDMLLPFLVTLEKELFLKAGHPALVHLPASCQVPNISALEAHLHTASQHSGLYKGTRVTSQVRSECPRL